MNLVNDLQARKQSLRQRIIATRSEMAEPERVRLSQLIVIRLLEMTAYRTASAVLAYMNFGAEFSAEFFVRQALRDGKQVWLPKVDPIDRRLALYRIKDMQRDVAPGIWNIPEPQVARCKKLENLSQIEFILLPGVAFSEDGGRLGYGGGFYDKLLAQMAHRPTLVAAAFARQVVAEIPQEDTDRKIEWLVTENKTICCNLGRE